MDFDKKYCSSTNIYKNMKSFFCIKYFLKILKEVLKNKYIRFVAFHLKQICKNTFQKNIFRIYYLWTCIWLQKSCTCFTIVITISFENFNAWCKIKKKKNIQNQIMTKLCKKRNFIKMYIHDLYYHYYYYFIAVFLYCAI